jgi:hypothetical protein
MLQIKRPLYIGRVRGIADALDSLQLERDIKARVDQLRELMRECSGIAQFLGLWSDEAWQAMRDNQLDDVHYHGKGLRYAINEGLRVFAAVADVIPEAEKLGQSVSGQERFFAERDRVTALADVLNRHWPWMHEDVQARSLDDLQAGRVRPAQDVLHELQGVNH